jgi:hypothetical protein
MKANLLPGGGFYMARTFAVAVTMLSIKTLRVEAESDEHLQELLRVQLKNEQGGWDLGKFELVEAKVAIAEIAEGKALLTQCTTERAELRALSA